MKTAVIRVIKVILPNGTEKFEVQYEDGRYGGGCKEPSEAVLIVHGMIDWIRSESKGKSVKIAICYNPLYDIEIPEGLLPRNCFRPSLEEQHGFWKSFNPTRTGMKNE